MMVQAFSFSITETQKQKEIYQEMEAKLTQATLLDFCFMSNKTDHNQLDFMRFYY